jgi:hypothetical protein
LIDCSAAWASDENKTTAQRICTSFFIYFLWLICFNVFIGYKTLLFKHTNGQVCVTEILNFC